MHLNVDQDLTSKECFLKVEDEEESDTKTALHPILSIKNNSHILVSENIYQDTINFESKNDLLSNFIFVFYQIFDHG